MDRLSDYDYFLPEDRIAQTPLEDRAASKLLHLEIATGRITDGSFRDTPRLLRKGDVLILNDTRVTARRLLGVRPGGGAMEALLLARRSEVTYEAMVRPSKRLKPGSRVTFRDGVVATIGEDLGEGLRVIAFDREIDLGAVGQVPLPPYIHALLTDQERYQTVYASVGGSAAAPTAGLHFTPALLEELQSLGIGVGYVTLDVSLDTFRPIQVEDLKDHVMHGEVCRVPASTAKLVNSAHGRIIAVGTTSVRTLESFARGPREVSSGEQTSKLFIRPGYKFQIIDGMFTNFHMPKTSMLLMISALAGHGHVFAAYKYALENSYRFLSFGDSMLLL